MDVTAIITEVVNSPMFTPIISFLIGWIGLKQPAIVGKVWGFVMGASHTVDTAQEVINVVDAILKEHGLVPKDAETKVEAVKAALARKK